MVSKPTTRTEDREALAWGTLEAPSFGTLWLVFGARGLERLDFELSSASPHLSGPEREVPEAIADPIRRYFDGERVDFGAVPIHFREGTEFQRAVWGALRRIPHGAVRTYASIAAEVGQPRGMRAVGMANHKNPIAIVVPCHRVIEASHRLGGYGGGLERKRFLLTLEGAYVEGDVVRPGQMSLF
jgi:methylated-DNA-[protein]-cysteine S-methyltransferase